MERMDRNIEHSRLECPKVVFDVVIVLVVVVTVGVGVMVGPILCVGSTVYGQFPLPHHSYSFLYQTRGWWVMGAVDGVNVYLCTSLGLVYKFIISLLLYIYICKGEERQ